MSPRIPPSVNHLQTARRFYGMGAFAQAIDSLHRLTPEEWQMGEAQLLYGACLARLRKVPEAITVLTELLEKEPDCHEALTWMAALKLNPRDMEEAMGYARRAVELRPEDATGYGVLGSGYLTCRLPAAAIEAFLRAIELAPDVAEHRHNLALAYLMAHRHVEAVDQLRQAIALAPQSPESYRVLASTLSLFGRTGPAIELLQEGLALMPDCAPLHASVAAAFASLRNDEAAERHHRRALELSNEHRGGYGAWLLNQGRFEEADAIFQTMIREETDPAYAYYGLVQSRKLTDADAPLIEEMEGILNAGRPRPRSEMYLRYALGGAEEGRRRYGEAMAHFDVANRLAEGLYHGGRPIPSSRFAEERAQVERLYASIREEAPEGDPSEVPIFIVGMIRSGTTLLDQIVSSHPNVVSGGELRFWIEEVRRLAVQGNVPTAEELRALAAEYLGYARLLAGPGARITDKMPLNFEFVGVMNQAMPNAKFLHIRRHPIDTCLSIWTTFFGQGPLFAYDKRNVVAYYREYQRAMETWRAAVPADRLLKFDYEDLIADPEPTIRRVIEFCGLPWNDACLRHDENQCSINTPSRWQARQPIYRTSVERWRRYEPWLGEFAELLEEP